MRSPWWIGDWPVTQQYGCTDVELEPFNPEHPECAHYHDGLDIGMPCGTPIICRVNGVVRQVGVSGGGPYALIIEADGWFIWLFHLEATSLRVGQPVASGMPIAFSGNLGVSTGCHLHFEVNRTGNDYFDSVDPAPWLAGGGGPSGGGGCMVDIPALGGISIGMMMNLIDHWYIMYPLGAVLALGYLVGARLLEKRRRG